MSAPPQPLPKYIYKILAAAPPSPLPTTLPLSDLDRTDGYIHLSTASQVPSTASRFFAQHGKLWLLKLELATFEDGKGNGRIVWEPAKQDMFPHLYDAGLGDGVVAEVMEFERPERGGMREGWPSILGGLEN